MSVAGTVDAPLDLFGGLVTDMAAADLPAGVSPDCQDCAFVIGAVKTRPGLQSVFAAIGGNPTINYLKTFSQINLTKLLLALDSTGALWGETTPGVLASIATGLVPNSYGKSDTYFSREYLAIHDGKFGIDLPRQYDGTYFDRVSQVGPGQYPSNQFAGQIFSTPYGASITNCQRAANVVTVNTAIAHGFVANQTFTIGGHSTLTIPIAAISRNNGVVTAQVGTGLAIPNGSSILVLGVDGLSGAPPTGIAQINFNGFFVTINYISATGILTWNQTGPNEAGSFVNANAYLLSSFNGTFQVASVGSTTQFTYNQAGANEGPIAGVTNVSIAGPLGSIVQGNHQMAVAFITRDGYTTKPTPPFNFTAYGNMLHFFQNLPVGPLNVIARQLVCTAVNQATFFSLNPAATGTTFRIQDNSTQSWPVDFSDAQLLSGQDQQSLFTQLELGECAGVIGYADRLFWWGERNKLQNFQNPSFDGGFVIGGSGDGCPLGWFAGLHFTGGGQAGVPATIVFGGAYQILGNGATAVRGVIYQGAFQDYLGVPIIQPNVGYSVRCRLVKTGALTQGTFNIFLADSAGAGIETPISTGLSVTAAGTPATIAEFIAPITPALGLTPLQVTKTLVLTIDATGTPSNGAGWVVDCVEIFPTNQPYNTSIVRASRNQFPESYDSITGFMQVAQNNGQAVRAVFKLRERLYVVKDRSLFVTDNDGQNEPSVWKIDTISETVGTLSVHGVDVGEDWAVIAAQEGLYLFDGKEPVKISQEIQPLWDSINWAAGQTLWVRVDTRNKRILCGVPLGAATTPNRVLMMDYRGLITGSQIIDTPPVHFSSYSGKLIALAVARKWCPWIISANSCALIDRPDGTRHMFLGSGGAGTGKIYDQLDTQLSDDGAAIDSYYKTYFFLTHMEEQQYQVRAHRKLFSYLTMFIEGAGNVSLTAYPLSLSNAMALPAQGLISPALKDLELTINVLGERVAFQVATNQAGSWFKLERFIPSLLPDPWAPVRGNN